MIGEPCSNSLHPLPKAHPTSYSSALTSGRLLKVAIRNFTSLLVAWPNAALVRWQFIRLNQTNETYHEPLGSILGPSTALDKRCGLIILFSGNDTLYIGLGSRWPYAKRSTRLAEEHLIARHREGNGPNQRGQYERVLYETILGR